jgi:5-methyltetrahydrofolate--homocysteine methyltransferase
VLIVDGAMGTNIQRERLSPEDWGEKRLEGANDWLVLRKPEVIERIHRSFLDVGCDVLETCTFQSTRARLEEWGLGERTRELNLAAARLARRLCEEYERRDGRPRFVAGSMGPTGFLPSSKDPLLGNVRPAQIRELFHEQARALVEGGVDALLIETQQDILETKQALLAAQDARAEAGRDVVLIAQPTLTNGRMLLGTDVGAALVTLEALRADVVGLNCSTGPHEMIDPIRTLCERASVPVSCIPNAGIPVNQGGEAVYPLSPEEFARELERFVRDFGVSIVGGCCGTTPAHLAALVARISGARPLSRTPRREPAVSSSMSAVALVQKPPPLLVGERVNAQGSRRAKELLLADDIEGLVEIAREQAEGGAHLLDVCAALTERQDEPRLLARTVKELSLAVASPLMIDSTEPEAIAEALDQLPGRGIVNSINLESGRARLDAVLPHVARHGAAVVALCIDEAIGGMAKTREQKVSVARKIYEIATREYGLLPEDLIFDALTFTLATGEPEFRRSAIETIEGIRAIKAELPGTFTILGVSNISFGLAPSARAALNSCFLYHCVRAGLDSAIVNPRDITPYAEIPEGERRLCDDLIFDRAEDALPKLIEHFEGRKKKGKGGTDRKAELAALSDEERIRKQILLRIPEEIEKAIDRALLRRSPRELIDEVLLPAMKEVGDKFGAGELILPFVLQSAEVMKRAVSHVERFLDRKDGQKKGRVVLATVFGDVHDIGKNLVKTILANNGFEVFDLGKQVPVQAIIDKAVEIDAHAIGLSALLVSTSKQMPICVRELAKQGRRFPVIVGGAAINRNFGMRINRLESGALYEGGCFYAKDAFEGLAIVEDLVDPARKKERLARLFREVEEAESRAERRAELRTKTQEKKRGSGSGAKLSVPPAPDIPSPPFFGVRRLGPDEIDLREVYSCFDLRSLFRLSWGVPSEKEREFAPVLERLEEEAIERRILLPQAAYGYFRCEREGEEIVLYEVEARFSFPRQAGGERLCLSDYFREKNEGGDIVALMLVSVGPRASEEIERLERAGRYADSYHLHGFATQAAEALAEWLHRRIRRELGIDPKRGLRYSFGYPACPDLSQHATLCRLLDASAIGVALTAAWQLVPEQSTSALVVHHPAAKYFSAALPPERQ